MNQLIQQLITKYGITEEQASGIIETITNYQLKNNGTSTGTGTEQPQEESFLEKAKDFVEDHIPGGMKEKAEQVMGAAEEKLKGFFK